MNYGDASIEKVAGQLMSDGFVVIEGILDPGNVMEKREALAPVLASSDAGSNSFLGFRTRRAFGLLAKIRCFDDAVIHPLLLGVLDEVLGDYQLCVSTAIEIGPAESRQTLHTDDSIYPLPRSVGPLTVNSMWAIDDFTEENGATRLIARSHLPSDPNGVGEDHEIVAAMPAGSVLIYLGSLLHGGGANSTRRPRLGVVLEFVVSWLRSQENLGLTYPPDVARLFPQRLRELVGYSMVPPLLGYVDGRNPAELLR